ncbi:hypothetical protein [Mycobacteroides abscessus]|uniref:hypothetical protein n=1 Tax=Mycobacteroides abscessus TaxID=36809 RepID=UPI000C25BD4D|nr:hypothetical protein [Mycobacteroides abscessus]
MATREELLRDLILSPRGQLTIPSNTADRETRKAIRELTEGDNPRADYAAGVLDLTAHPDDMRLNADQQHNVLAAARNVLLTVTTPRPEVDIAAHFASSGFTPEMVRDGVNFLRRDRLATRRDGVVTVTVPAPAKRPSLPADLLAPRNTAAPSTSTPANRPRMPAGGLIEHPDQHLDMGARLRREAEQMPTASFEVGNTAKPTVKKDEKPATPTIPDSAVVAFTESVLDMWARHGTLTARWAELPWDLPTVELPEGVTSNDVANHVFYNKLVANGTVRKNGEVFTYVPAERAVTKTVDFLTRFIGHVSFDTHTRADLHRDASGIAAPDGWSPATITDLALTTLVADGTLTVDGDTFTRVRKPEAPAPAPKPAEQDKPKTAPKPAGDTTSSTTDTKPEGTSTVAPASGQKTADPAPSKAVEKPETLPAPVNAGALEKKVDKLTDSVERVERKLHTLPPPPTKEQVMLADASPEARHLLEKILVQLKVKQRVAEEDNKGEQHFAMTRDDLKSRMPGRARVTATNPNPPDYRKHVLAALELGRAMGVIDYTEKWLGGSYVFITHVNVMSRAELDRRVQRVLDIRKARAEKQDAA